MKGKGIVQLKDKQDVYHLIVLAMLTFAYTNAKQKAELRLMGVLLVLQLFGQIW